MNSRYRFILYALVILMVFGAIGLLAFEDPLLESRSPSRDLNNWVANLVVTPQLSVPEDMLKHSVLLGLKNYIVNFDFDRVCWRPNAKPCAPGNSLPFLIEEKDKEKPAVIDQAGTE